MSAHGMATQALAAEIVAALLADEKDGGYDLTAGMFGASFSALVRRWAALELEQAAVGSAKLLELADRIDYEQLWRKSGLERDTFYDAQRDRLTAGVMLRRYARLIGNSDRWILFPPRPGFSYAAGTLDAVVKMAKKREDAND